LEEIVEEIVSIIALEKFNEFPELDSIQRVSMSVQPKGLRIRAKLESAATQRTAKSTTKVNKPKFQFHVNTDLQKQLPITTQQSSYSSIVMNQSTQKKQLMIVRPDREAEAEEKQEEREARMEEKRLDAQREMFSYEYKQE
jgi:hypothetical protein